MDGRHDKYPPALFLPGIRRAGMRWEAYTAKYP